MIRIKAACETIIYLTLSLIIAYTIVWINELAMDHALTSGPVPSVPFTLPGWQAAGIVLFGMLIVTAMISAVTERITHRQIVPVILNGR